MPSISSAEARLDELMKEVARGVLDGGISDKRMSEIEAESERLEIQIKNQKAARGLAGSASPASSASLATPANTTTAVASGLILWHRRRACRPCGTSPMTSGHR